MRRAVVTASSRGSERDSMGTIVVTGSAGGIGRATCARLEKSGHHVVGVDVRDAEVIADLRDAPGRAAMVTAVERATDGVIDGLVAGAGVMGDEPDVVSINYFGAVATLAGLRPLLARSGAASAVAISSNSTTTQPALPTAFVDLVAAGNEEDARAGASRYPG